MKLKNNIDNLNDDVGSVGAASSREKKSHYNKARIIAAGSRSLEKLMFGELCSQP